MDLKDYIIVHDSLDVTEMLREWNWLLPSTYETWIINRFGDVILILEDASIAMLDTGAGRLDKIAESKDHFISLLDNKERLVEWFMIGAVNEMVADGKTLKPKQCYSYGKPPGLGGAYHLKNYEITDLAIHLNLYGQTFEKTKDLPDGAGVTIKLK